MNTHDIDIELPPLPTSFVLGYAQGTIEDIENYARAAIEADRKRRHLKEKAQLEQEWSLLKSMQAQYEADLQRRGESAAWPADIMLAAEMALEDAEDGESPTLEIHASRIVGALSAPQPAESSRGEPVAYLDLGVGGYMDLGTALADEQLAALPKGRHMLAIVGTYGVNGYTEAAPQPAEPVSQHPDGAAVDAFAATMKAKLAKKRAEGRGNWQMCTSTYLSRLLREHVEKGDPVDVANLAMMLHQNGQRLEPVRVPGMRDLIADDAYAATFQSLGQYRKALLARHNGTP